MSILNQTEIWVDASGDILNIEDMEESHKINLMNWLVRNAAILEIEDAISLIHSPLTPHVDTVAHDDFSNYLDGRIAEGAEEWMCNTELYKALERSIL